MSHEAAAVAVPCARVPVTGVGQSAVGSRSSPVKTSPPYVAAARRTAAQAKAGEEVLLRAVPVVFGTSKRAGAVLPSSPLWPLALCSASAPHASRRLAEIRRYALPLGLLRLPGVTGPRRLRSEHGFPVAPPPWCGQWRKIELFGTSMTAVCTHARKRSFGLPL